jgi:hypothetical protein
MRFTHYILTAIQQQEAQQMSDTKVFFSGRSGIGRRAKAQVLTLACVLVVVSGLGCASLAPKADPIHAAYLAAATADVVATQQALDRGGQEVNPLLGSQPSTIKLVGVKAAGWFAARSLESYLESRMNRQLKWWERVIVWGAPIGVQTWAAYHNSNVARR